MAGPSISSRYELKSHQFANLHKFTTSLLLLQADNESEMKNWVTAIDHQIIIVDERKDLNKLKKLTSFR